MGGILEELLCPVFYETIINREKMSNTEILSFYSSLFADDTERL